MCCYPNQEPTLIDLERWCGHTPQTEHEVQANGLHPTD
jgi:hypothetical protein